MKKIFCPCSPKTSFDHCELTPGLLAKRCPSCSAVLLALDDYRPWRDRHFPGIPAVEPAAVPGQEEHSKARVCPSCQQIMRRYRTGSAESFWLDYCPSCQLAWLDQGEWETLEKSGLALHLDTLLTERWQRLIEERKTLSFRDVLLEKRFGAETLTEIRRVKNWLDAHPRRKDILLYLAENR
jgi:Zn-finger nucleic acid-binding protein